MQAQNEQEMRFGLVRDMLSSVQVVRDFDPGVIAEIVPDIQSTGGLLLTGEGSSRIFPAKNAIAHARRRGDALSLSTEAARQAAEYDLSSTAVFGVSNSGRTAEVIRLFQQLKAANHPRRYSLTATNLIAASSIAMAA